MALEHGAEQVAEPCTALHQRITFRCGSGIERGEPLGAERQLPPDPPRGGAEDKSERTVKSYSEAVRLFADFLAERGHP